MDKSAITSLFLSDSYHEQLTEYNKMLNNKQSFNWDVVVITASNEKQAKGYRKQIDLRKEYGLLPLNCDYVVIPDKDNLRIGSGGATLNVINVLKNDYDNFDSLKILLIHSGGDSKRIPQYSALGKLFSPVPRELAHGFSSTLFDELLILFSTVPNRMDPGMVIICGDALLLFNPLQLDLQYKDLASITMKAEALEGTKHGVITCDRDSIVKKFLHKQSIDTLKKNGAVVNNKVNIDTGVIYYSNRFMNSLYDLVKNDTEKNIFINDNTRLNVYSDFLTPFASETTKEDYLNSDGEIEINENIIYCRKKLWELKSDYKYHLIKLSPAKFIHFGTSHDFYELMVNDIKKYRDIGWNRCVCSFNNSNKSVTLVNSLIDESIVNKSYIENSIIVNSKIGKNTIISNCCIKSLEIPDNICLSTLQVNNGFVTRIYGINDNPKKSLANIFNGSSVINQNVTKLDYDLELWDAKIYPVCNTMDESVKWSLRLYDIFTNKASDEIVRQYSELEKESLHSSFEKAEIVNDDDLGVQIMVNKTLQCIKDKINLNGISFEINNSIYKDSIVHYLYENIDNFTNYDKMRIYYILSKIDLEREHQNILNIFKIIKLSVSQNYLKKDCQYNVISNEVQVNMPVRLNFGGGWTDTPPYCLENGGTVLNAAIKLNGELPIQVKVEKLKDRYFILDSKDLNSSLNVTSLDEIKNCNNPNDSFALLKCAIIISGLIDSKDKVLEDVYKKVGGGIKITTRVKDIPKGSGLGTSSILSGALLKALAKFMNIEKSDEEISDDVLRLEQLMSTGGGWQDQVGGIFPGVKMITSLPNAIQKLSVEKVSLNKKEINEFNKRIILINTGQRRLARNLLRDIVTKYVSNDEVTIKVLKEIREIAECEKQALIKSDYKEFGKLLDNHWNIIKKMDPGSTNMCIETIIKVIEDDVYGKAICGAGGGGFIIGVLKDGVSKKTVENHLEEVFADTDVKLYDVELYDGGME